MNTDFQMNYYHNKGNLHVKMQGIFDGNSVHELPNLSLKEYRRGGRVFVDTAGVNEVLPLGNRVLQAQLYQTPAPTSQLLFKDENEFNMAPSGSRVLIVPPRERKSGCYGKRVYCICHGERGHGHGHGGCVCRGEHNHDH